MKLFYTFFQTPIKIPKKTFIRKNHKQFRFNNNFLIIIDATMDILITEYSLFFLWKTIKFYTTVNSIVDITYLDQIKFMRSKVFYSIVQIFNFLKIIF